MNPKASIEEDVLPTKRQFHDAASPYSSVEFSSNRTQLLDSSGSLISVINKGNFQHRDNCTLRKRERDTERVVQFRVSLSDGFGVYELIFASVRCQPRDSFRVLQEEC